MVEADPISPQLDKEYLLKQVAQNSHKECISLDQVHFDTDSCDNKAMAEIFKCIVCEQIGASMVQDSNCNKFFCQSCITAWLAKDKSCPSCRMPFKPMVKMDLNLKMLLDNLSLECPECSEMVRYEGREKHYSMECKAIRYSCKQGDCQVRDLMGLGAILKHF